MPVQLDSSRLTQASGRTSTNHRIYANFGSTLSLPLRHSLKLTNRVYATCHSPLSHCQIDKLPLTLGYLQDLQNPRYHLLYDLIGNRHYASCPDLIATSNEQSTRDKFKRTSTFYRPGVPTLYKASTPPQGGRFERRRGRFARSSFKAFFRHQIPSSLRCLCIPFPCKRHDDPNF